MLTAITRLLPIFISKWKYIIVGLLVIVSVFSLYYAYGKSAQVESLKLSNKYSQLKLEEQSQSISNLTSLQNKVSEQMLYRDTARKIFNNKAEQILGELDALKQTNQRYRVCSESELPYHLDSLFDGTAGVHNKDDSGYPTGSLSKEDSLPLSTREK